MDGYEKWSLTLDQIGAIKREAANRPYSARLSLSLAVRLLLPQTETLEVLREIDALEGIGPPTQTKPAAQFRHPPLDRLWHKHFYSSRHAVRNIGERWGMSFEGNADLEKSINRTIKDFGNDPSSIAGAMAHHIVVQGLEERADAGRLTGDWIIFAKHQGENYYLELATHEQGQDGEALFERLRKACCAEFPFLFEPLQD